jgi:hypothetical protein
MRGMPVKGCGPGAKRSKAVDDSRDVRYRRGLSGLNPKNKAF